MRRPPKTDIGIRVDASMPKPESARRIGISNKMMTSENRETDRRRCTMLRCQLTVARGITGMATISKTYGTVSADRRKEMSGLEFVQGLADGSLPLNIIARTLGYDVTEAANGRVVITAEPTDQVLNPAGTVHGGFSATLLDSCMGLAI